MAVAKDVWTREQRAPGRAPWGPVPVSQRGTRGDRAFPRAAAIPGAASSTRAKNAPRPPLKARFFFSFFRRISLAERRHSSLPRNESDRSHAREIRRSLWWIPNRLGGRAKQRPQRPAVPVSAYKCRQSRGFPVLNRRNSEYSSRRWSETVTPIGRFRRAHLHGRALLARERGLQHDRPHLGH